MKKVQPLSITFQQFFDSEKSGGLLLIACTLISLAIANSPAGPAYMNMWHMPIGGLSIEHWINDALMAIFFLFIGLELERELYSGELSDFRNALLPIFAAVGGMLVPALIHFSFTAGTPAQAGIGIPMATDIAFALGILALLGARVPPALKVFVVAFAVIDDLGAIVVIAIFYTEKVHALWLLAAIGVWLLLVLLNRKFRVMSLLPYLLGGALMWFCMLKSGIHATIAGVLLAFAIPFSPTSEDAASPSHRLEHALHKPVAFLILPLFALANTGITVGVDWIEQLTGAGSAGIVTGLTLGKPLGVLLFCFIAVRTRACALPPGLRWRHIAGAGMIGGIGFTMSIFIANLAYAGDGTVINASKLATLAASVMAGFAGFLWLRFGTARS